MSSPTVWRRRAARAARAFRVLGPFGDRHPPLRTKGATRGKVVVPCALVRHVAARFPKSRMGWAICGFGELNPLLRHNAVCQGDGWLPVHCRPCCTIHPSCSVTDPRGSDCSGKVSISRQNGIARWATRLLSPRLVSRPVRRLRHQITTNMQQSKRETNKRSSLPPPLPSALGGRVKMGTDELETIALKTKGLGDGDYTLVLRRRFAR